MAPLATPMPTGDLLDPCERPGARGHHVGDPCCKRLSKFIGVRSGGSVGRPPPGLEKFHGKLCFQGKRKLLKNPEWQKMRIQYSEKATLFFRASASCSKILNNKKYVFRTVNSGYPLFFRASASCSKILNGQRYIQYSENFQRKLCFQGKRKLLKILNVESIFNTVKILRATLVI